MNNTPRRRPCKECGQNLALPPFHMYCIDCEGIVADPRVADWYEPNEYINREPETRPEPPPTY